MTAGRDWQICTGNAETESGDKHRPETETPRAQGQTPRVETDKDTGGTETSAERAPTLRAKISRARKQTSVAET